MIDIKSLLNAKGRVNFRAVKRLSKLEKIEIFDLTQFLDEDASLNERIYCLYNNITSRPVCANSKCNNGTKYVNGKYRTFCSSLCSNNSSEIKAKKKQTIYNKYGVDNPLKADAIKSKIKQTNMERYGVDNPAKSDQVKQKISHSHANKSRDEKQCTQTKRKITSKEKYGVDNPAKSDQVKQKIQQTNMERYGVDYAFQADAIKSKIKQTNMERYGVDNPAKSDQVKQKISHSLKSSSELISERSKEAWLKKTDHQRKLEKNKRLDTNMKKYGVSHYSQTKEFKEKVKQTSLVKWGTEHPMQNDDIKKKVKSTNQERYGVSHHLQLHHMLESGASDVIFDKTALVEQVEKSSGIWTAKLLGVHEGVIYRQLRKFGRSDLIGRNNSGYEAAIQDILDQIGVEYEQHNRTIIAPYELDFYLPKQKIAIEVNGLYWHSEITGNKDKYYHYNKWKQCRDQGITLLSYCDDDILYNIDKIRNKIAYVSGIVTKTIGARKCVLGPVSSRQEQALLEKYHIQGKLNDRDGSVGMYYDNILIGIMNWKHRKTYLEITRYATETSAIYPGLFSRALKYMIQTTSYFGDIVSFSNNDHSSGNLYQRSGFQIEKILGPSYWYIVNGKKRNRQNYMKSRIEKKFNIDMDGKTEWQAMQELGFDRIWDTGKIKWKLNTNTY